MPPTLPNMCPVLEFAQYEDEDLTPESVDYFFEMSDLSEGSSTGGEVHLEEGDKYDHGSSHEGKRIGSEGFTHGDNGNKAGKGESRPAMYPLHDQSDYTIFGTAQNSHGPQPYRERSMGGRGQGEGRTPRGNFAAYEEGPTAPLSQLQSSPLAYANPVLTRVVSRDDVLRILHSLMARVSQVETNLLSLTPMLQSQVRQSFVDPPKPPKIHKSVLDRACMELFECAPEPTPHQLTALVARLVDEHPGIEYRSLLSLIRKWFRKRREDVGNRLLTAIKRKNPDFKMKRARLAHNYQTGLADICQLVEEARLPLPKDPQGREVFIAFCKKKVIGHLERQPQSG